MLLDALSQTAGDASPTATSVRTVVTHSAASTSHSDPATVSEAGSAVPGLPAPHAGPISAAELEAIRDRLAGADVTGLTDEDRIDLLRAAEEVVAATAGLQVAATADLAQSQSAAGSSARGIAAQVGLAQRRSAQRAERDVAFARTLSHQMPHALLALRSGHISEWRARLIVRETDGLDAEDRRVVDEELCADPRTMDGWGDGRAGNEARKIAYRLDPHAALARSSNAANDRYVSCRPAPDTMTRVTGMMPVVDGVAVYAALSAAADAARCDGDERSRSQVMADELVARVTGRPATTAPATTAPAAAGTGGTAADSRTAGGRDDSSARGRDDSSARGRDGFPGVKHTSEGPAPAGFTLTVNMVITDRTLLAGDNEPAHLDGYGTVPASWARARIAQIIDQAHIDPTMAVMIRRLFTAPVSGDLVAMESRARKAPRGLAELIRLRDETCRIPFCDARIRHTDHLTRWSDGGPTSAANLAGTCEAHNYAHEDPGWAYAREGPGPTHDPLPHSPQRHTYTARTPTGHTYTSTAPAPPGTAA